MKSEGFTLEDREWDWTEGKFWRTTEVGRRKTAQIKETWRKIPHACRAWGKTTQTIVSAKFIFSFLKIFPISIEWVYILVVGSLYEWIWFWIYKSVIGGFGVGSVDQLLEDLVLDPYIRCWRIRCWIHRSIVGSLYMFIRSVDLLFASWIYWSNKLLVVVMS